MFGKKVSSLLQRLVDPPEIAKQSIDTGCKIRCLFLSGQPLKKGKKTTFRGSKKSPLGSIGNQTLTVNVEFHG